MSIGFYGKIPTAGDFVTRGLPYDFVQRWDRWLARHIAPLIDTEFWHADTPYRFISGAAAFGRATGVVVASSDRVGRRFPLSLVAMLPATSADLASNCDRWFAAAEDLGRAAQTGALSPDELNTALAALPFPAMKREQDEINGLVIWIGSGDRFDVDLEHPIPVVKRILEPRLEFPK